MPAPMTTPAPMPIATAVQLRPMTPSDVSVVNEAYNHYVLNSTCTYQITPDTEADRMRWLLHRKLKHPAIVAVEDEQVVGWGSLGPFRAREAYDVTVEHSVYVLPDRHRRGVGGAIMQRLIDLAVDGGFHTMVGVVDSTCAGSLSLHERYGFVRAGVLRQAGRKFDRPLDAVLMQRMLASA